MANKNHITSSSTGLRNVCTFPAKTRSKVANITSRGELGVIWVKGWRMSFIDFLKDYFEVIPVGAAMAVFGGVLWSIPNFLGAPSSRAAQLVLINELRDSAFLEQSVRLRQSLHRLNQIRSRGKAMVVIGLLVFLYGLSKCI